MFRSSLVTLALAIIAPCAVAAQSLSAQDILAQVDKKVAAGGEYQALLADPDPSRALAAMQIMLASGDAELMRIALDAGLYSPNPSVQRTAFEAFIRTGPVLNIYIDASSAGENEKLAYWIGAWGGSMNGSTSAFLNYKVGEYDKTKSCYTYTEWSQCMFRITDDGVSYYIGEKWNILHLNDQAELVGMVTIPEVAQPLPIRIPVVN